MNTKSSDAVKSIVPGSDPEDPMKPASNQSHAAPDMTRFTMTQTTRDPETGALVTGKESEK